MYIYVKCVQDTYSYVEVEKGVRELICYATHYVW